MFAVALGREHDAAGRREQPQPGDGQFARDDDDDHPCLDLRAQRIRAERKDHGQIFGPDDVALHQRDEGRAGEDFVGQRIHERAEVGDEIAVARELAITGLRLLAASKNTVLAAERYGKHKTISQIAAIIALLVMDAYGEWWPWLREIFAPWTPAFALFALWLTVLLTFTSGALYLWRNRPLFLQDL